MADKTTQELLARIEYTEAQTLAFLHMIGSLIAVNPYRDELMGLIEGMKGYTAGTDASEAYRRGRDDAIKEVQHLESLAKAAVGEALRRSGKNQS